MTGMERIEFVAFMEHDNVGHMTKAEAVDVLRFFSDLQEEIDRLKRKLSKKKKAKR